MKGGTGLPTIVMSRPAPSRTVLNGRLTSVSLNGRLIVYRAHVTEVADLCGFRVSQIRLFFHCIINSCVLLYSRHEQKIVYKADRLCPRQHQRSGTPTSTRRSEGRWCRQVGCI